MNTRNRLGASLLTFGVLLLAIKVGLEVSNIAGGGGPFLTFAAGFAILLGVAFLARRS